jgi:membrane protease YdiL (CAAX protease family)
MKKVFINSNNETRSGWKIAGVIVSQQLLTLIVMSIFGIIAGIYFVSSNRGVVDPFEVSNKISYFITKSPYGMLFTQSLDFICLIIILFIFLKKVDKKTFKEIGFTSIKKGTKSLILGLLLGFISISFIFFILLSSKNISVTNFSKPNFSIYTFSGLLVFVIVGIKEELLSRGYCITALNQMNKPWISVIISSVIFSALHLLNPNVKPLGIINIILVGVLFGYMFVKTKSLWMPIGYHITWNYFQGCIYGFNVSGLNIKGVFNCNILKENILTGGAFGPEAGILTTIVILMGLLVVNKYKLD